MRPSFLYIVLILAYYHYNNAVTRLSSRHGTSSGCEWWRRSSEMEGSCEYIE
jgi:hypothetical protein